jgi:ABC-type phosphate transport system substrate-binding protein
VATERGLQAADLIHFPLAGQAIVIAYNLPGVNFTDPALVLNLSFSMFVLSRE